MPISNKTRLFDFLRTLITVEQWFNFRIFLSRIFAKVCELKAFNLNIFHASNFFIFLLILEHEKFQYYPLIRKMTFCLLNSKKTSLQKFFIFHLLFFLNNFGFGVGLLFCPNGVFDEIIPPSHSYSNGSNFIVDC